MTALGLPKSVLGVDVVHDGRLVAADADEEALLALAAPDALLVVTPVGGQGFVLGRGNQQLVGAGVAPPSAPTGSGSSPRTRRAPRGRCSPTPATPSSTPQPLRGYRRVITGYRSETVYRARGDVITEGGADEPRARPYIPNSAPEVKAEMLAIGAGCGSTSSTRRSPSGCGSPARSTSSGIRGGAQRPGGAARPQRVGPRPRLAVPGRCSAALRPRRWWCSRAASSSPPTTARDSDHGKLQAFFEYASMVGDLVECDVVAADNWGSAAASARS